MFKNMSIKMKLVIMVALPVMVLLYLVGQDVYKDYKALNNLDKLKKLMMVSQKASDWCTNFKRKGVRVPGI